MVLDADGAVVIAAERIDEVLASARERAAREEELRAKYQSGTLSYDLYGLRSVVEDTTAT